MGSAFRIRVPRSGLVLAVVATIAACVTSRALSEGELRDFSTREYDAPFDEVYDATWLSLERFGYVVTEHDRRAGTFTGTKLGRRYDVEVSSRGERQAVAAIPSAKGALDAAEEAEHLELLEDATRELLKAWREVPEWTFDARRNSVEIATFKVSPPLEWQHLDLSVDRHRVTVQRKKNQRTGINPTIVIDVGRRRPGVPLDGLVAEVAGVALSARMRLSFPEEARAALGKTGYSSTARVMDGPTQRELRWFAWNVQSDVWAVRVIAVCGPDESDASCAAEWPKVARSVISEGYAFAR